MMDKCAEPYPVRSVEKIEVIRTTAVYGQGHEGSPIRIVFQYWTLDGEILAKVDTWQPRKEDGD